MTPEGPATGGEAVDHQVGHPADHLHVAIHTIDAPGDTEAPHHTILTQSPSQDPTQHEPTAT